MSLGLVIENNKILLYLLRKANKFYKYKLQNSFSKKKSQNSFPVYLTWYLSQDCLASLQKMVTASISSFSLWNDKE